MEVRQMQKRYLGRVELNYQGATVTIWDVNSEEEDNHLISVWDIAGTPGWTWAFQVDGRPWVGCAEGHPGYEEIYSVYNTSLEKVKADHGKVLDIAIATGFIAFIENNY